MSNVYFKQRPVGQNWIKCFLCGEPREDNYSVYYEHGVEQPEASGTVRCKEHGFEILAMFARHNMLVVLDDRNHSARGIQIKIGACHEHFHKLERLFDLIRENNSAINDKLIEEAIDV
jgi:hypothetical protein